MTGLNLSLPGTVRSVPAVATALALLLPLPARCAACTTSAGGCPRCVAEETPRQTNTAGEACCQHRNVSSDKATAAEGVVHTVSRHSPRCGCKVSPVPRTATQSDQSLVKQHLANPQPYVAEALATAPRCAAFIYSGGELPPPVPHRILHCSWLI